MMLRKPSLMTVLVGLAGAIVAAAAALLAGSGAVLSREMSWDLLFNLAGAWHLQHGQTAHVDFHDPVGQLYFRLTQLGFWLYGPTVWAFLAGYMIATAAVFAAAAAASAPRLPPVATMIFILFNTLLVLMPTNVGDGLTDFTFAMSYNAYGWAAISILSLLLFVPRRQPGEGCWTDAAIGGLLIVALYYLKVTYFAAAVGELAVAFVAFHHVRHRAWLIAGGVAVANAVAPHNWPYLADVANVLSISANVASYLEPSRLKDLLRASAAELALYAAAGAAALGLWLTGRAPWRLPMAIALLVGAGATLLAFNAQSRGIPLAVVALFLLYAQLRRDTAFRRVAPALLIFPLGIAVAAAVSVVAYHQAAAEDDELLIVDITNLRGLAVPADDVPIKPGEEIEQDNYVETLLEAAALLERTGNGGRGVALLDQVNPMPFIMGQPPQRGARLWLDVDFPWRPSGRAFTGVNHVLIPKRSTYAAVTRKALSLYGSYLKRNFPVRTESRNWTLLSRAP